MYAIAPRQKNFGMRPRSPFDLFDEFDRQFFSKPFGASFDFNGSLPFKADLKDDGEKYILEADFPGFSKEDINVELEGNRLTIKASHESEESKEDSDGRFIIKERRSGSFERSFHLKHVDSEKVSGKFENGVLSLDLPKIAEKVPAKKEIALS